MKNFTLLFLSTCYLFSCSVNNEKENSLTKANLKGNVSFVDESIYNAEYKFGEIQKGSLVLKRTTKYDDKGNEIEENMYEPNMKDNLKLTYKYDDIGNRIEHNIYSSDGSLFIKSTYKYDDKGNELGQNFYNSGGSLYSKSTYKYDDKGNKIEENSYNSDGSLDGKVTYKYDDKGNKIEENSYNSDGSLDGKVTYKYEFDKIGNWIKQNIIKNDEPQLITERVIEYY